MVALINSHLNINVLDNGSIENIFADKVMINQVAGNLLDGSMGNIYLRLHQADGSYTFKPLLGPESQSDLYEGKTFTRWKGNFDQVDYVVDLQLNHASWYWTIQLKAAHDCQADLTYVQDLGLGDPGFVQSNEAYSSQYIDHHVETIDDQIVICSRQNQPQSTGFPYVQQGSFGPLDSYSTDGFQFFGSQYKLTSIPQEMQATHLQNINKQYEAALTALRTKVLNLGSKKVSVVFYGTFVANQPKGNTEILVDQKGLKQQYQMLNREQQVQAVANNGSYLRAGHPLVGSNLSESELKSLFPNRNEEELQDGKLLSFFTPDNTHVVLPVKEQRQERLTGNIVLATTNPEPAHPVMAATQYMPGQFAAHVVFGNTNMNILTTHTCDALDWYKLYGTRIYLKYQEDYRPLGMPSAFAMTYDGADWYYKLDDDLIHVSSDASADNAQIEIKFSSEKKRAYSLIVTMQLDTDTLGKTPQLLTLGQTVTIHPVAETLMAKRNPQLAYEIQFSGEKVQLIPESSLFKNKISNSLNLLAAEVNTDSTMAVRFSLSGEAAQPETNTREAHIDAVEKLVRGFNLESKKQEAALDQTNRIVRWFAHDAMVHLLSPHGLEQYGGAAWGTRDVAQGPTELFLATQHYEYVRKIITTLYAHQHLEDGNWPQWFMFDEYSDIYADESHGDVIVWPLKVIVDYILASGDVGILNESVPYLSTKTKQMTHSRSLAEHVTKQLDYIESHYLYDTHVSAYGDGDWDDTLQPADSAAKKQMASTWTEELTIETLRKAARAFKVAPDLSARTQTMAADMWRDFQKYFMTDNVLPGFIKMNPDHQVTPIIHPNDGVTGVDYRLLPLSQGVLSKILNETQSQDALALIRQHLLYPDGVRLMDKPSTYHGGVSQIFKRAEQASNFGREIGLLYVHAHIRYANAVAVAGDGQEAWRLLQLVNPIQIKSRVKNAAIRQANVYFSSSDADFDTRYDAQEHYDELRNQSVAVKGGWRLYSSGPGIYIGTLLMGIFNPKNVTFNQEGITLTVPFDSNLSLHIKH